MNYPTISDSLTLEFSLYLCSVKNNYCNDGEFKTSVAGRFAEETCNPATGGNSDWKPKEVADNMNNEDVPQPELNPLIRDKDYPAGVREWMMTAPAELKFATLAVASAMLAVYATRLRLNYVYDNSLSAILLHVLVCGEQSSGKSFARYLMTYLMAPLQKRDAEQRSVEQKYAELKRRQGKRMVNCLRSQRRI